MLWKVSVLSLIGSLTFGDLDSALADNFIAGNDGDLSYPPTGEILPTGALAVRGGTPGCQDQGVGFSVITDGAVASAGTGVGLHAGINGGCQNGLTSLASYGSFDSATEFAQNGSSSAPITVSNVTYAAQTITPPSATIFSLQQLALLTQWTYVLTNSTVTSGSQVFTYGSYIGLGSDGRTYRCGKVVSGQYSQCSFSVVGWTGLGSGNTQTGQVPSTTYRTGTVATVYIGQPTNLFTRNEVCALGTNAQISGSTCSEIDVVNNSGADSFNLSGHRFIGMGANSAGDAIYVGSVGSGISNAFYRAININGFKNTGIQVAQAPGLGGVGLGFVMSGGFPIAVSSSTQQNVFTLDTLGDITTLGTLKTSGLITANAGISIQGVNSGYPFVIQTSGTNQFLVDSTGDVLVGATLTVNGPGGFGGNISTAGGLKVTGTNGSYPLAVQYQGANTFLVDVNGDAMFSGGVSITGSLAAASLVGSQGLQINTAGTSQPACSSTTRSTLWVTRGASGVADGIAICLKSASGTYAWANLTHS